VIFLRTLVDFHLVVVIHHLKLSGNHPDLGRYLIGNQFRPGQDIRIGWARGMNIIFTVLGLSGKDEEFGVLRWGRGLFKS
jgi:hypothetical protein